MSIVPLLVSADSALGRLDPSLLSQQAQMEIAFQDIQNRGPFLDENGNFIDISEWHGLRFNEVGNIDVIDIDLEADADAEAFGGSINFAYLPITILQITFDNCRLRGTISTRDLPPQLTFFSVANNFLRGAFAIASFPPKAKCIDTQANNFSGTLDCRGSAIGKYFSICIRLIISLALFITGFASTYQRILIVHVCRYAKLRQCQWIR